MHNSVTAHPRIDWPKPSRGLDAGADCTSSTLGWTRANQSKDILFADTHGLKDDQCSFGRPSCAPRSSTVRLPCGPAACQSRSAIQKTSQPARRGLKAAETAPCQPPTLHGTGTRERSINLAFCTTHRQPWVCAAQGGFQGCAVTLI